MLIKYSLKAHRAIQNLMLPHVYEMVKDCLDYDSVVKTLDKLYIKTPNVMFARHRLATRHQQLGEPFAKYLQEPKRLSKDCKLRAVTIAVYQDELVRDFLSMDNRPQSYANAF